MLSIELHIWKFPILLEQKFIKSSAAIRKTVFDVFDRVWRITRNYAT